MHVTKLKFCHLITCLLLGMFVWSAVGAEGIGSKLFENQFPVDEIYSPKTIPSSQLSTYTGRLNYVVTKEGDLIIGKRGDFPGGGHIDLAQGKPVQAAGEFKVVNGKLKYIDNSSGHYLPTGHSAQAVAERAFNDIGIESTGKYLEKYWYEDPSMQNGGTWRVGS